MVGLIFTPQDDDDDLSYVLPFLQNIDPFYTSHHLKVKTSESRDDSPVGSEPVQNDIDGSRFPSRTVRHGLFEVCLFAHPFYSPYMYLYNIYMFVFDRSLRQKCWKGESMAEIPLSEQHSFSPSPSVLHCG